MKVADFWEKTAEEGRIRCKLCPHTCLIGERETGLCGIRRAEEGELKAVGYGLVSSAAMDPIEKKPLYHFHPGTYIFSIGGWGCNFSCAFCQNWSISQQVMLRSERYSPEDILAKASANNSIGIAYTYNEPLVGFEFVEDCARIAKSKGLVNVLVTNGFLNPGPAEKVLPLINALNIDIKSMDDTFYRKHCRGALKPVLAFAEQAVKTGCHVEVTNLLIPGLNDSEGGIEKLARWVRDNLGESVPLHLSAYRPQYKLTIPATAIELLERAYRICREVLPYVYLGNVLTETGQNTECRQCGKVLINRQGYRTEVCGVSGGTCNACGASAVIVGHESRKSR